MTNKPYFTSNTDEWATPQSLFDELDAEFNFNLDPCATDKNHKCVEYYTKADNGLEKSWGGAECSAIPRIVKYRLGLKRRLGKQSKTTRLLFC